MIKNGLLWPDSKEATDRKLAQVTDETNTNVYVVNSHSINKL